MTYNRLLKVINKLWLTTEDIMLIAECGRNNAIKIRTEVEKMILAEGKHIPVSNKKRVPTKLVLEYLGLDEEYIKHMANIYKEVK